MTKSAWFALLALAPLSTPAAAPPPDRVAWDVFLTMATPAMRPGGKAVAFETWASDDDIYNAGAHPRWPAGGVKLLRRSLAATTERTVLHKAVAGCQPADPQAGGFPPGACIGEEVQHNYPVFKTIADNGLYSKAGLVKAFADGKPISFPSDAIVVKADWALVDDVLRWKLEPYKSAPQLRRSFYTNVATMNGRRGEYALLGLSVQSKALPQWLWMTFEHRSNPGRCDIIGCHDGFGAAVADVPGRALPNANYGPCAKSPALLTLFARHQIDPVWRNYCLKGTQTDFTAGKQPTILANSVIERMNKGVAVPDTSCITCHAYAAFDPKGMPNASVLPSH
ncbi:MAG TPA: hypothetical protein VGB91_07585, partial [Rhizomicrobium sp.]